ncbi:MAG TPA: 16S rRNA (cytosine(1402)-N(4))-methyltransferase RsmH [Dehalococcoidales bacterium]|nr:16S rRNA (cytosine(1402)-N(4))-methyltransferase RsmH [Dehalococcoidales bacterium]
MLTASHIPVLAREVIELLAVQPGGRYIDCTLGGGGHAQAILEYSHPGGQLMGIDADPEALIRANRRLNQFQNSVLLVNDNFVNLKDICLKYDFYPVHGILFDLGLSSPQLDEGGRGFSFQYDAPLDMRFNPAQRLTAADIVNTYSEAEIARIIKTFGEEINSRQIARYLVQKRPVYSTGQLADLVEAAVGGRYGKIHPATRTFQALRIAVNHEMENLESALRQAISLLGFGGRLAVISYHSLEDRIVKHFFQKESKDCLCPPEAMKCVCGHQANIKIITRKIITPSFAETEMNPRSRSAKLRVCERLITPSQQYEKAVEHLNCSLGIPATGWGKPAMLEKLRRTFLHLQRKSSRKSRDI